MGKKINLNADIGEGYGAYDIGDDASLMKIIKSASVACGFHAGDPTNMVKLVRLAQQEGVSLGVHPGFNDIWGFGRRKIQMDPKDLEYMVAYQIGALQAMASYEHMPVTHLKAHGALNNMAAENEDYAMAIGRAIKAVDDSIVYVALAGSEMQKAAERLSLPLAREGFADRSYEADGNLTPRTLQGAVHEDAKTVCDQVVRMAGEGEVMSRQGTIAKVDVETICVHGDEPTAVAVAGAARDGLVAAGFDVVPLPEMDLP